MFLTSTKVFKEVSVQSLVAHSTNTAETSVATHLKEWLFHLTCSEQTGTETAEFQTQPSEFLNQYIWHRIQEFV